MRVFPARDTQKRMTRGGRVREEKGEKRKQGMMTRGGRVREEKGEKRKQGMMEMRTSKEGIEETTIMIW